MARPLRLEFAGAVYHLTSRGNARQKIFFTDADRELFLSTLAGVVRRYHWICHAYCLMANHYHLLIETPKANLSIGMRQLNGIYTQSFNRRHHRPAICFKAVLDNYRDFVWLLTSARTALPNDSARRNLLHAQSKGDRRIQPNTRSERSEAYDRRATDKLASITKFDHGVKLWYFSNMSRALSQRLEDEVPKRLAELLAVPVSRMKVERQPATIGKGGQVDLIAQAGGFIFVVECKSKGEAASAAMAARQVRAYAQHFKKKAIPVVAVPYMGEVGRKLCDEAGVSWLDLSGNAHLFGPPGLRVHVEGKPNLFKRPGRPRSVFAPKSTRIARLLLIEPKRAFAQRELAKAAGLDEGFTSRIVRQLEEQRLVSRQANGTVRVADFNAMLDAWREAYDFSKHHIVRGHIAARSSDEVLRQLAGRFKRDKIEHAATGLAGAWLLNQFAGFRLVVSYVARLPSAEAQRAMGFREESHGENVWLVVPNDESVFHGSAEREGIRCVHPVQAYLDLKNHPERSAEAAEQLRRKFLNQKTHA